MSTVSCQTVRVEAELVDECLLHSISNPGPAPSWHGCLLDHSCLCGKGTPQLKPFLKRLSFININDNDNKSLQLQLLAFIVCLECARHCPNSFRTVSFCLTGT